MSESDELWATRVASLAPLPDARLGKRLSVILEALVAQPESSLPQAAGTWKDTKAIYRFLENDRVSDTALLRGLRDCTARACVGRPEILLVQDTTTLNISTRAIPELGPVSRTPQSRGLLMHTCLGVGSDGEVLGVLDLQRWVRPKPEQPGPDALESGKWLEGFYASREAILTAAAGLPVPRLIHIGDRESDMWDLMQAIDDAGDGAILRCAQNRVVEGPVRRAHDAVRSQPVLHEYWLDVPRKPCQSARVARVQLRVLEANLVPDREKYPHGWPMTWSLVEVWEPDPPEGVEGLRWLLWTREAVGSVAEVLAVVEKYRKRWLVEEYHLVLKSGCRVEELQLESWSGLQKALVMYSGVAARVLRLKEAARREPESDAREMLDEEECEVLQARFGASGCLPGVTLLTLKQAVLWIGRLGGHLNRKGDGMPGVRTIWKGLRALDLLIQGARAAKRMRN